jgi:hypothetical protein
MIDIRCDELRDMDGDTGRPAITNQFGKPIRGERVLTVVAIDHLMKNVRRLRMTTTAPAGATPVATSPATVSPAGSILLARAFACERRESDCDLAVAAARPLDH